MDPISMLFAAYLEMIASDLADRIDDQSGSERHTLVIEYRGIQIPYEYETWSVVNESVCNVQLEQVNEIPACSINAKLLFNDLCRDLSESQETHWKFVKTKEMYCAAAAAYHPAGTEITQPSATTPLERARQRCNLVVAKTMGQTDGESIIARRNACRLYESLRLQ